MSLTKRLGECPATSDPAGLTLLAVDTAGSVRRLTATGLIAMLAATGSVMTKKTLPRQDIDADTLTDRMTVYTTETDITYWPEVQLRNLPGKRPQGSFILICLPEGPLYCKQLYMSYYSADLWIRYQRYDGTKKTKIWEEWRQL